MALEHLLEGEEATNDVLDRVGSVDSDDQFFRAPGRQQRVFSRHIAAGGKPMEGSDIDRHRIRPDPGDATSVQNSPLPVVDPKAEQFLAAGKEVAHISIGLETDDIAGKQAIQGRVPHSLGQDCPILRGRPGNVDEVLESHMWHPLTNHSRGQVEVIVLEEDQGSLFGGGRSSSDGFRDALIDGHITLLPGGVNRVIDYRGKLPEIVLDEPEQWIGNDAVVLGVRLRRRRRIADGNRRVPVAFNKDTSRRLTDPSLGQVPSARDPRGTGGLRDREHGGDDTAGGPPPAAFASTFVRSSVRGDDGVELVQRPGGVRCQGLAAGSRLQHAPGVRRWELVDDGRLGETQATVRTAGASRLRYASTQRMTRWFSRTRRCPLKPSSSERFRSSTNRTMRSVASSKLAKR